MGNRQAEGLFTTPYSATVVDRQDLLENASRTLPQAFLDTPGVLVQQTTPGHGSPFIRSFTGRQNLLLLDGVRLNNSTWRSGPLQYWNTLDSQAIERIELIKSQGSVLYGSDAIGGTVNVLSRSSGFIDEEGFFSRGAAYYRFDTNSKSHLGRVEQAIGVGDEWGLMLGVSGKDIGDLKDSAVGRMRGTGYTEQSLDFKFEYALASSRFLTLTHTYFDQDDVNRWHSTVNNQGWVHGKSFTTPGSDRQRTFDQERSLTYLRLEDRESSLSWIDRWQATLSFQRSQDSEFRVRASGQSDARILDVDTYGLTFQAETGSLVWGTDFYYDRADSQGFRNGLFRPSNRPVADDSTYLTAGVFGNYGGQLGENFFYDLGARFSYVEADWKGYRPAGAAGAAVDQAGSFSAEDLSASMRLRYELDAAWSLFGGLSQAFRAPNLDDLTGSQFALNGLTSTGSPDVDPEHYLTAELGTRLRQGEVFFETAVYHTWINEGIVRVADGMGGLTTVNGSEGEVYGVESSARWRFHPDWALSAHGAWQDGKQNDDTIQRLHPLQGALALRWQDPSKRAWVSTRLQAAARQDNLSQLDASDTQRVPINGTPGYLTASVYAGYQVNEALELNFAFENLTDEDYRIHGSGQNSPGRNATVSVKFAW